MKAEDPIETILRSIEEETSLDWDAVSASGASASQVASLRDVHRIAEFNRRLVRSSGVAARHEDAEAPKSWGELLLLERVGSGAGADVYRAWDGKLAREVALKLMRGEVAATGADSGLLTEGRALARIRHPNVVAVHSIESHDGRTGLAMELVRGGTLEREVLSRGPLPVADAVRLGLEMGSALEAVHAAGILHRDLKPANVIRDETGKFVLADFGLGFRWDDVALERARPSGTPMYMAPELLAGGSPSGRTELYSLGLLLWFALVGRHPYEANSMAELRTAQKRGPDKLSEARPDAGAALASIVERAISADPSVRFASASEWSSALRDLDRKPAGRSVSPRRVAASVAVMAALAVAAVWVGQREDQDAEVVENRTALGVEAPAQTPTTTAPTAPAVAYEIEATFVRRDDSSAARLVSGDRVRLGDRLSLEVRTSRAAYVYVLNEDERGECYLLYPQPLFDQKNPVAAGAQVVLPGTIDGRENAWTVTSQGGREHFLVVASPEPVAELEAELGTLPAPQPGRPIQYASVGAKTLERLRGAGGLAELAPTAADVAPKSATFEHYRSLAANKEEVRGVWVRHIVFENPAE